MKRYWILPALFILSVLSAHAADWRGEFCGTDDKTCLILEQTGSTLDLYYRNKVSLQDVVTTVTFESTGAPVNLRSPLTLPHTREITGTAPVRITTMEIIDTTKRWDTKLNYYWTYGKRGGGGDAVIYGLPYELGKKFRVCQGYNGKVTHHGEFRYSIDWVMPVGTPVHAARDGLVVEIIDGHGEGKMSPEFRDKTNLVVIQHDDGTVARYCHMVKGGARTSTGRRVKAGDIIMLSGNSGYSDGPHLHFDVYRPLDGKRRETVPVRFRTSFSEAETLLEGNVYYHDGGVPRGARPKVEPEDIVLCRKVENNLPSGAGTSFSMGDTILLFLPVFTAGEYAIKTEFYSSSSPSRKIISSWRTRREWWYTYGTLKTSGIPDSSGAWKADVYVDGTPVKSMDFTISP